MQFKRCPSSLCGRPYQINEFGRSLSPLIDLGRLTCPHCGLLLSGETDSTFLTHALSEDEEAAFNASNPTYSLGSGL
jgi:hypothetical protein